MNNDQIEKNIREYLTKTVHMSLATSKNNKPWVCEVHFATDENLNLYFISKLTTRHCQEIDLNSFVAGNIVKQHLLIEAPHGVYFEGRAEMLKTPSDQEIDVYCRPLERDPADVKERLSEAGGHGLYKIVVDNWSIFGKFDGDTNQKHELAWNGGKS